MIIQETYYTSDLTIFRIQASDGDPWTMPLPLGETLNSDELPEDHPAFYPSKSYAPSPSLLKTTLAAIVTKGSSVIQVGDTQINVSAGDGGWDYFPNSTLTGFAVGDYEHICINPRKATSASFKKIIPLVAGEQITVERPESIYAAIVMCSGSATISGLDFSDMSVIKMSSTSVLIEPNGKGYAMVVGYDFN